MKIVVYGKPDCNYCVQAKKILDSKKFEYQYQDITIPGFDVTYLKTVIAPGTTTVPVITMNGKWIGGYTELAAWIVAWEKDINILRALLANGETVAVTFTKKDGTLRTIQATKNFDFIPDNKKPAVSGSPIEKDPDLFVVFDLVKQDWRSFYAQKISKIV